VAWTPKDQDASEAQELLRQQREGRGDPEEQTSTSQDEGDDSSD
jgi:hypothetical protein